MATLLVISGPRAGKYYPLGHRTNVVGRDEGLLIQILDEHVSRKHFLLRYDKQKRQYFARDLQSRHGVYVNGCRIDEEVALEENDTIDIGRTSLMFTRQDSADREGALADFRRAGERHRMTMTA